MSERPFVATVPAPLAGVRVDRAVSMLTGVSRAVAAGLVECGQVLLADEPVRTRSLQVAAGQELVVHLPEPDVLAPDETVRFGVVHEDDAIIVVDKPPGLVVHPGSGTRHGTLAAGLLARDPDIAAVGDPRRPGIVHRLDRGTSGLLVVARTPAAHGALSEQLAARTVGRRYLALVAGHVESDRGIVDAPIGRSDRAPTKMAVVASGRPARTTYQVLDRIEVRTRADGPHGDERRGLAMTLVSCTLETGRTHQIRVHLSAIGHPVIGDDRYGHPPRGVVAPGRLFLHAAELSIDHPSTGQRVTWTSPLPDDLAGTLRRGE